MNSKPVNNWEGPNYVSVILIILTSCALTNSVPSSVSGTDIAISLSTVPATYMLLCILIGSPFCIMSSKDNSWIAYR